MGEARPAREAQAAKQATRPDAPAPAASSWAVEVKLPAGLDKSFATATAVVKKKDMMAAT